MVAGACSVKRMIHSAVATRSSSAPELLSQLASDNMEYVQLARATAPAIEVSDRIHCLQRSVYRTAYTQSSRREVKRAMRLSVCHLRR